MSEIEITNPVAQEQPGVEIKILKHKIGTRVAHGCVAVSFIICAITGFLLWLGVDMPRGVIALVHGIAGLVLIGAPVVYVCSKFGRFSRFVDTITHFDKDDAGWWKAPVGGYLSKKERHVPAQDKYNSGQKLLGCIMMICVFILGISGILMWTNAGVGLLGLFHIETSPGMTNLLWTVHIVIALIAFLCFCGHFWLAAIFSKSRMELPTMFGNGETEYDYTKKKNGKWLNTLVTLDERIVPDAEDK